MSGANACSIHIKDRYVKEVVFHMFDSPLSISLPTILTSIKYDRMVPGGKAVAKRLAFAAYRMLYDVENASMPFYHICKHL